MNDFWKSFAMVARHGRSLPGRSGESVSRDFFFDYVYDEALDAEAVTFCQRVGDHALQLSSVATVHESIREFPPLNNYSAR